MARSLRIEYPGAYYHVMARGNRREAIFLDEDDRRFFLKAVSQACKMTGRRVHAWLLMGRSVFPTGCGHAGNPRAESPA